MPVVKLGEQVTGAKFTHVPYKGGAEWMQALMGGEIQFIADAAQWAPFVDDGNSFWAMAGVPAITHGPKAGGQHTVHEWASIDDLARVAHLYALTAILYCSQD